MCRESQKYQFINIENILIKNVKQKIPRNVTMTSRNQEEEERDTSHHARN